MPDDTGMRKESVLRTYPLLPAHYREEMIKPFAFDKTYAEWEREKPRKIQLLKQAEEDIDRFNLSFTFDSKTIYPGYERLSPQIDYLTASITDEWQCGMKFGYDMAENIISRVRDVQEESLFTPAEWVILVLYSRFEVARAADKIGITPEHYREQLFTIREKSKDCDGQSLYDILMNPAEADYVVGETQLHV